MTIKEEWTQKREAIHQERHIRIICIGAGASGLCLAYKLQRSFRTFTLAVSLIVAVSILEFGLYRPPIFRSSFQFFFSFRFLVVLYFILFLSPPHPPFPLFSCTRSHSPNPSASRTSTSTLSHPPPTSTPPPQDRVPMRANYKYLARSISPSPKSRNGNCCK